MTPATPRGTPAAIARAYLPGGLLVLFVLFLVWVGVAGPFLPTSQTERVERAAAAYRASSGTADDALARAREMYPDLTFRRRDRTGGRWSVCKYDQFGLGKQPAGVSWIETRATEVTPPTTTTELIGPVLQLFVDDGWDPGRRSLADGTVTKDEASLHIGPERPDDAGTGSSALTITVESGCLEIPDGYSSWDPSRPGDAPTARR